MSEPSVQALYDSVMDAIASRGNHLTDYRQFRNWLGLSTLPTFELKLWEAFAWMRDKIDGLEGQLEASKSAAKQEIEHLSQRGSDLQQRVDSLEFELRVAQENVSDLKEKLKKKSKVANKVEGMELELKLLRQRGALQSKRLKAMSEKAKSALSFVSKQVEDAANL